MMIFWMKYLSLPWKKTCCSSMMIPCRLGQRIAPVFPAPHDTDGIVAYVWSSNVGKQRGFFWKDMHFFCVWTYHHGYGFGDLEGATKNHPQENNMCSAFGISSARLTQCQKTGLLRTISLVRLKWSMQNLWCWWWPPFKFIKRRYQNCFKIYAVLHMIIILTKETMPHHFCLCSQWPLSSVSGR